MRAQNHPTSEAKARGALLSLPRRIARRLVRGVLAWRDPFTKKARLIQKTLGCPVVLRDSAGFQLIVLPDEPIHTLLRAGYLGTPELREQAFCRTAIEPGMSVVDVGANIGQFTMLFAQLVGRTGRVYAFEPVEQTCRRLRANLVLNGLEDQVEILSRVVHHEHDKSININVYPEGYSVWNTIRQPVINRRGDAIVPLETVRPIPTPSVTLDAWMAERKLPTIHYLKIDVEGAELDVLRGAQEAIATGRIHVVQFEVTDDLERTQPGAGADCFSFLLQRHYLIYAFDESGRLFTVDRPLAVDLANYIAIRATDADMRSRVESFVFGDKLIQPAIHGAGGPGLLRSAATDSRESGLRSSGPKTD